MHSGMRGGLFREPLTDMLSILSQLSGDKIKVPDFYSDVLEPTKEDDSLYETAESHFHVESRKFKKASIQSIWHYPSLTIHNIQVSGPGTDTVIPG